MISQSRKVLTLNVWHDEVDWDIRSRRIGQEIREHGANIVLLQEIPFENIDGTVSSFLDTIIEESGLNLIASRPFKEVRNNGKSIWGGLAILSDLEAVETNNHCLPAAVENDGKAQAQYAVLEDGDSVIVVINAHGHWGGHMAPHRERQFKALNTYAGILETQYADRNPIVLLGGDFNTEPESSVTRYLTGLQGLQDEGTYWVDTWNMLGAGPGYTSTSDLKFFHETARNVGILHPQFTPDRRIDYLMIKGWVYGRRGMPLDVSMCFTDEDENGYTASDHYGLVSNIWCP